MIEIFQILLHVFAIFIFSYFPQYYLNFVNIKKQSIIERISMGTTIYPGDVIGSGTCATGCFLELNQKDNERWLRKGDKIELRVDKLGTLTNKIL